VPGAQIKTKKQQVCRAGEFLVAEIDAKAGGYGLVPPTLEGAVVSSHYFLFEVDKARLDREYLGWYSRTDRFFDQVRAVGSTNYAAIRPTSVLKYTMPLPSLQEQRRIVARMDTAAGAVNARAECSAAAEAEIAAALAAAFARITADAPRAMMGEVAPLVRRPVTIDLDTSYSEIGVRSFYRGIFTRRTVKGEEFDWQKLFRVHEGDLVFSNLMAWEQAIGLAGPEHANSVGNHRMLTCEVDRTRGTSDFLFYYFNTPEGFRQVLEASPGTMVRNKTLSTKLLPSIIVPLPPLDEQRWFDELQAKATAARKATADAAAELAALLPAMLNEAFGMGAGS
jgi:type I restriction enzyme S subunit